MSGSALQSVFKLAFECAPIVLSGGLAENIPGKMLPLLTITETASFISNLVSGSTGLDKFFAHFAPMPGGTLIENQIGTYPFANQAVAANAVIAQPLKVSLLMFCPVRQRLGYATKLATMMALQSAIKQHNATGGTYTVITPSAFFADCVMTSLTDVSSSESKQVQNAFRWDFEQPLLTLTQAQQAYNSAMGKIASGVQSDGATSGLGQTVASPPSIAVSSVLPSASSVLPASVAAGPPISAPQFGATGSF